MNRDEIIANLKDGNVRAEEWRRIVETLVAAFDDRPEGEPIDIGHVTREAALHCAQDDLGWSRSEYKGNLELTERADKAEAELREIISFLNEIKFTAWGEKWGRSNQFIFRSVESVYQIIDRLADRVLCEGTTPYEAIQAYLKEQAK